jgi:TM2 domain-containing membrane protein YozV
MRSFIIVLFYIWLITYLILLCVGQTIVVPVKKQKKSKKVSTYLHLMGRESSETDNECLNRP